MQDGVQHEVGMRKVVFPCFTPRSSNLIWDIRFTLGLRLHPSNHPAAHPRNPWARLLLVPGRQVSPHRLRRVQRHLCHLLAVVRRGAARSPAQGAAPQKVVLFLQELIVVVFFLVLLFPPFFLQHSWFCCFCRASSFGEAKLISNKTRNPEPLNPPAVQTTPSSQPGGLEAGPFWVCLWGAILWMVAKSYSHHRSDTLKWFDSPT